MRKKMYSGANLLVALCVLSVTYSCEDRDDANNDGQVPVSFTSEIKGSQPASRAVGMSWTAGDKVGINMVAVGSGLSADAVFRQYKASNAGKNASIVPVESDQTLYYPTDDSSVNFIAFSPYKVPSGTTVSYSEFSDQSTEDKIEAVDFLYHKGTTAYDRTNNPKAVLTFTHKLSKLVIKASLADDPTSATIPLNTLAMKISGIPASFSANLSNGMLIPSTETSTITPYHTDGVSERITTAIIVPHGAKGGRTISFALSEDRSFVYDIPSDYVFESGKAYELEFKLTRKGIELTGSKINDWVDGNRNWNMSYNLNLGVNEIEIPISGGDYSISFETSYTGGVSVQYSTSPTDADAGMPGWIELSSLGSTSTLGVTTYKSKFRISENMPYRIGYAHITVGKLAKVIPVSQGYDLAKSSNCIVLQTGGLPVAIPVGIVSDAASYPNIDQDPLYMYVDPFLAKTSYNVKVLWVDSPGFADASRSTSTATDILAEVGSLIDTDGNSYLAVTPGTKEGNAVVCITDPTKGYILWSWHIWVLNPTDRATLWIDGSSENTITEKPAPTANGYAFMPLNMGAFDAPGTPEVGEWGYSRHPYLGMVYQWGRKDPTPYRKAGKTMMHGALGDLPSAGITGFSSDYEGEYTYRGELYYNDYSEDYNTPFDGLITIEHPYNFNYLVDVSYRFTGTISGLKGGNNSWGYATNYSYSNGKSPFDPCPAGWRVPPGYDPVDVNRVENDVVGISAWKDAKGVNGIGGEAIVQSKNGISSYYLPEHGGFYPCVWDGEACYWSGSPIGEGAYCCYLGNGEERWTTTIHDRDVPYPVRCVAE